MDQKTAEKIILLIKRMPKVSRERVFERLPLKDLYQLCDLQYEVNCALAGVPKRTDAFDVE